MDSSYIFDTDLYVLLGPVAKDVVHVTDIVDRDPQPPERSSKSLTKGRVVKKSNQPRFSENKAEVLTRSSNCRRVDDRGHFLNVI